MDEHSDLQRSTTSIVWDKFEKLPITVDGRQKAMCKMCKQEYVADSRSSNLLRHLTSCPKGEYDDSMTQRSFQVDQDIYREKIFATIIRHNYSFKFVEHEGIKDLHSFLNPNVKSITRNTTRFDVLKQYKREKEKFRHVMESIPGRICLTSNLWSSLATDGYLALTAHYVDENWILRKKILNFCHMPPPHNGPILAEKVIHFLKEWDIEKKIFTLTLDNAKYNDGLVEVLKCHLSLTETLLCGEFFHVHCGADILNLIVEAGLKVIDEAVCKIRESVKYVRGSEGRKIKFAKCITQLSLNCSKKIRQDMPTRWNYTYLMLEGALIYRQAFFQLQQIDTNFKTCPSEEEWVKVERIVKFLKPFHDITTLFSGSHCPSTNLYFHEVWKIQKLIKEELENSDDGISCMARKMKDKFDKYWECYSIILSFAIILDPRYKLQYVDYCFSKLHPVTYGERVKFIDYKLHLLFDKYMCLSPASSNQNQSSVACASGSDDMDEFDFYERQHYVLNRRNKSQLDLYLEEQRLDQKQNLDVLSYWKDNKLRYPELALMARDILSIPITTVASESSFNVGGQIVNKYRSSINPKNVEALLCTQDWFYGGVSEDSDEEELVEDFESIIGSLNASSNVSYSVSSMLGREKNL